MHSYALDQMLTGINRDYCASHRFRLKEIKNGRCNILRRRTASKQRLTGRLMHTLRRQNRSGRHSIYAESLCEHGGVSTRIGVKFALGLGIGGVFRQ